MINNETKLDLVEKAAQAIVKNNGQLLYTEKTLVRTGKIDWTEEQLIIFCLVDETIAHHIPVYNNYGEKLLRDPTGCWSVAEVFRLTNVDEEHFKAVSCSDKNFNFYRVYGTIELGRLEYRDDSHYVFQSGSGGSLSDFIDLDYGYKIEAKYNYFSETGSPSKLHDADFLLNYTDYSAELYPVVNKRVSFTATPIALYDKQVVIPRRHLVDVPGISHEFMQLIKSGELIPDIKKRVAELGFTWNS
jgi:hypothetical protein